MTYTSVHLASVVAQTGSSVVGAQTGSSTNRKKSVSRSSVVAQTGRNPQPGRIPQTGTNLRPQLKEDEEILGGAAALLQHQRQTSSGSDRVTPLSPTSARKRNRPVVIFDWDDTLFPTWFITEVLDPCRGNRKWERLAEEDSFYVWMMDFEETMKDLLVAASQVAHVGIVTLSARGWVENSARKYLPILGDNFMQFLDDNGIAVK